MPSLRHTVLLLASLLSGAMAGTSARAADKVRICDDAAEWAPFIYYAREGGKVDRSRVEGATVDLLAKLFERLGLDYSITSAVPGATISRCTG